MQDRVRILQSTQQLVRHWVCITYSKVRQRERDIEDVSEKEKLNMTNILKCTGKELTLIKLQLYILL
jgi:hypothetical protein